MHELFLVSRPSSFHCCAIQVSSDCAKSGTAEPQGSLMYLRAGVGGGQGPPLGAEVVDCGAMVMPGAAAAVQALVDDAVRRGAKVRLFRLRYSTAPSPSAIHVLMRIWCLRNQSCLHQPKQHQSQGVVNDAKNVSVDRGPLLRRRAYII